MLKPFLEILLGQVKAAAETFEPAEVGAVGPEDAGPAAGPRAAAEEGFSFSRLFPESARRWGRGVIAGPTAAMGRGREAVMGWYRRQAAAHPHRMLIYLSGVLLTMTLLKCCGEYLSSYQLAHVFYFMNLRMKADIFRNVLAQDYLFFAKHSPGYLISRISSDVQAIRQIIDKLLSDGIQQPLMLAGYSIALVYISPKLTLITVAILPPIAGLLYHFNSVLRKNTKKQKKKADELTSSIAESLYNIRLVKAMGTEEREIEKYLHRSNALFRYIMNRRIVKFASGPIMEVIGTLAACGVILLGGYMILGTTRAAGSLEPTSFFIYLFLLTRFYRPLKALSATTMRYQVARVSAERIQEMMAFTPSVREAPDARPFTELREGVEVRDVTLRYKDRPILRRVCLNIPRGRVVALVGPSGAGKTTIANLIPRLIDPEAGQVLLDGVDLRQFRLDDLRRRIGIVTQQTILFDDTVANNIMYGSTDGAEEPGAMQRAVAAARLADAEDFIGRLDGGRGYATRIGPGGARLSGGQAQRIAIARALFRNPQILIFDEATSALDTQSQALVQEAINRALVNRTALIISHRLSTVRNADWIYVIDDGRIVEEGTHATLMAGRGTYYRLYHAEGADELPAAAAASR